MTTEHIRYLLDNRSAILDNIVAAARYTLETEQEIIEGLCLKAQELKPDRIQTQTSEHVLELIAQKNRDGKEERSLMWQIQSQKDDIERLDCIVFGLHAAQTKILVKRYYERKNRVKTAIECECSEDNIDKITTKAIQDIARRWEAWDEGLYNAATQPNCSRHRRKK